MNKRAIWQKLQKLASQNPDLRDLFAKDKKRAEQLYFKACGIGVDISKQHLSPEILSALLELAKIMQFEQKRADMFAGRKINITENRAVLHMALRGSINDENIKTQILTLQSRMRKLADKIKSEAKIKTIIHIGIGGSDLGPRLLADAFLADNRLAADLRFVNNVDGASINNALGGLRPENTLIICVSKSFGTEETKLNGLAARNWLGDFAKTNLLAVTANIKAAEKAGIEQSNIFEFWDWVGGRFSLWSAVSLSLVLAYGADVFDELLAGANAMDLHFLTAEPKNNIPLLLALVGVWNRSFLLRPARAVIPYANALRKLPQFLQQLEMESLGKSACLSGGLAGSSAQIVFGDEGTNAQHAFFQALHQGPDIVPVDFLAVLHDHAGRPEHHKTLLANCFAQSEALMQGRKNDNAHKNFPGNRPSTTFVLDRLDARTLGALIALFEHKVFAASVIWDINAFDQFGVELGKVLATDINAEFSGGDKKHHDSSTARLIALAKPHIKS